MAAAAPPRSAALVPGIVWGAALVLAPFSATPSGSGPFGSSASGTGLSAGTTAAPWLWGIGTVLLILVFPWVLVRILDQRGDLRRSIARAGVGPVILGAGALCFILLRLILWLNGPRELAAVVFAMIACFTLTLVVPRAWRPDWPALSLGAAVVILPALLWAVIPPPAGWVAAFAAGLSCAAVLLLVRNTSSWALLAASAAAGAVVGGGVFLLLWAASG